MLSPLDVRRRLGAPRPWLIGATVGATLLAAFALAVFTVASSTTGVADLAQRVRSLGGRPLELDRVAPVMRQAIVADEDERFYRHHGIDAIGLLRAVPYDLVHLSASQGASTITEQLAKLAYLGGNDHSPRRKLQDAVLAARLEHRYSKEQILAAYLDSAYFGEDATGITAAARRYFSTSPSRLTLAQASLLAGLVQAPTADDPIRHPTVARSRQVQTLRSMVRQGYVTETEAEGVLRRPLALATGDELPALQRFSVDPGPPFAWGQLAWSIVLVAAGAVAIASSRRRRRAFRLVALAVGIVVAVAGLAGAIGSFRVA